MSAKAPRGRRSYQHQPQPRRPGVDAVDAVAQFHDQLHRYRLDKQFCDFELRCGELRFPCHQVVIRSRARLSPDMASSDHVELRSGTPASAVEAALRFLYTFSVNVDCSNVASLNSIAQQLHVVDLSTRCHEFLLNVIPTESNWFWLYECALEFDLQSLRTKVSCFIVHQFSSISKDFVKLDFAMAQEVLSSNELPVSDEREVHDVVRRWIQHKEERMILAADMLHTVRLPMMQLTTKEHRKLIRDPVFAGDECQRLFDVALDFSTIPATRWSLQSSSTRPRSCAKLQESLMAVSVCNTLAMSIWDETTKQWKEEAAAARGTQSVEEFSRSISVVCDHMTFYAVDSEQGRIYSYDRIHSTEWKRLPSTFEPRKAAECVLTDGVIYLIGGQSVERMDNERHVWSSAPAMPSPVTDPTVFFMNDKIYVIGGCDVRTHQNVRHIQVFHCENQEWTCIEQVFPEAGRSMSAVCYEDVVYVLANSGKLYKLDVATFEAREELDLAVDCTAASMVIFNGNVVAYVPYLSELIEIRLGDNNGSRVAEMGTWTGGSGRLHLFTFYTARQVGLHVLQPVNMFQSRQTVANVSGYTVPQTTFVDVETPGHTSEQTQEENDRIQPKHLQQHHQVSRFPRRRSYPRGFGRERGRRRTYGGSIAYPRQDQQQQSADTHETSDTSEPAC